MPAQEEIIQCELEAYLKSQRTVASSSLYFEDAGMQILRCLKCLRCTKCLQQKEIHSTQPQSIVIDKINSLLL